MRAPTLCPSHAALEAACAATGSARRDLDAAEAAPTPPEDPFEELRAADRAGLLLGDWSPLLRMVEEASR